MTQFYDGVIVQKYYSDWISFKRRIIHETLSSFCQNLKVFFFFLSEHYAYDDRRRVSFSSWKSITQYLIFMCYMNY